MRLAYSPHAISLEFKVIQLLKHIFLPLTQIDNMEKEFELTRQTIESVILNLRGRKVILDRDLAKLYVSAY